MTQIMQPIIYGEVLFDRFPDGGKVLGGAPFNVAWHLQAFGGMPLLISGIGNDPSGRTIERAMLDWQMRTDGLLRDQERPTGMVKVTFQNNEPSYDIVDNSAWDLSRLPTGTLPGNMLLYHGSLALRHSTARELAHRLRQQAATVFVDINLRAPWYSRDSVLRIVQDIDWLKLNENELVELVGSSELEQGVRKLQAANNIANIVVTRGENGAALFAGRQEPILVPVTNVGRVIDTVGAGDAFSAILILGILRGWDLGLIMRRAQRFAAAIVEVRGATVRDFQFYQKFMKEWSEGGAETTS